MLGRAAPFLLQHPRCMQASDEIRGQQMTDAEAMEFNIVTNQDVQLSHGWHALLQSSDLEHCLMRHCHVKSPATHLAQVWQDGLELPQRDDGCLWHISVPPCWAVSVYILRSTQPHGTDHCITPALHMRIEWQCHMPQHKPKGH